MEMKYEMALTHHMVVHPELSRFDPQDMQTQEPNAHGKHGIQCVNIKFDAIGMNKAWTICEHFRAARARAENES
jgi:hypothetical protein